MEPRGRVRTGLAGEEARGAEWYEPDQRGRSGEARMEWKGPQRIGLARSRGKYRKIVK